MNWIYDRRIPVHPAPTPEEWRRAQEWTPGSPADDFTPIEHAWCRTCGELSGEGDWFEWAVKHRNNQDVHQIVTQATEEEQP